MSETRKIAAILVSDVVGYSRLAGADEDRTLARLRTLRSDLIDPTIAVHHGRIVKRTGDGSDHRVPQRGRRGALRDRSTERTGRAQRRPPAREAHRISRRHSPGRRGRGERRRPHGRRRQYCRAARGHRQPGAICLSEDAYSAGQGTARSGGQRSRPDPTQEHRRAGPGLFAGGRQAGRRQSPRRIGDAPPSRSRRTQRATRGLRVARVSSSPWPRCYLWPRLAAGISSERA